MYDNLGRKIEYLRVSVTDRCNLRCIYCMPEKGIEKCSHSDILSYDDITRLMGIFAQLGVKKVRLTGGEPLVRPDLHELVKGIKNVGGIEKVCITTNGVLLGEQLPLLMRAGLDSVNISIDTLQEQAFETVTRRAGLQKVLESIDMAMEYPDLNVKLNCVPTEYNREEIIPMVTYFLQKNCALRFIEMMPIGFGKTIKGVTTGELQEMLAEEFGRLQPVMGEAMGGPCSYYKVPGLPGRVGFISAMSHKFCSSCNRVRLTSTGFLKTCLQYNEGIGLKALLQKKDPLIKQAIYEAVLKKPQQHHFDMPALANGETRMMSQIGG